MATKETTTLPARIEQPQAALVPMKSVDDLIKVGEFFERSGMFGCSQQGQGVVLAMTCAMSNLSPMEFIERYHLIQGRPSKRADAMLADLLELGGSYEIICRDDKRAAIKAKYRSAEGTFSFSWTEAQAERFPYAKDGKTLKDNWSTPRGRMQMLWARVVSDAVRTVCPLANRGTYTPEEVQEFAGTVVSERREPLPEPEPEQVVEQVSDPAPVAPVELEASAGPDVDYSVMPIGRYAGKKWSEFSDAQLQKALALRNTALTQEHLLAIEAELAERAQEVKP